MLTLHLSRERSADDGTPGTLTGMGVDLYTLEKPWVDSNGDGLGDPQRSCITLGAYTCEWRESPKYGWCYEVTGVKGRSHILIHAANREEELLGCIALGLSRGVMPNKAGKSVRAVLQSKQAIKDFHAAMGQQPFTLTITAAP